jgi:hypothetical protein
VIVFTSIAAVLIGLGIASVLFYAQRSDNACRTRFRGELHRPVASYGVPWLGRGSEKVGGAQPTNEEFK